MKKITSLALIILFLFQTCVFAVEPDISLLNSAENRISITGSGENGSKVSVFILNPGFKEEHIASNSDGAVQYFKASYVGSDGYAFEPVIRYSGDDYEFTLIVTTTSGKQIKKFMFYPNDVKKIKIIDINSKKSVDEVELILDDVIKTYSLDQFSLYKNGDKQKIAEALYNIKNLKEGKNFPIDSDKFLLSLKEALIVGAYNSSKESLLFSNRQFLHLDILKLDKEACYSDYSEINQEGKDKLLSDLITKHYDTIDGIRLEFNELVPYYVIKNYKSSGFGHVKDYLAKYSQVYKKSGFNLDDLSAVSNKNNVYMNLVGSKTSNIRELASEFNSYVTPVKTPADNITQRPGSVSGASGSSGGLGYVEVPQNPNDVSVKDVFKDLDGYDWATEAIDMLYSNGVINGKSEGRFVPGDNVTRAEFVKMIIGLYGISTDGAECNFKDVNKDWSYPFIAAAFQSGVVVGVNDDEFKPNANITREEAAVIVYKVLIHIGNKDFAMASSFSDDGSISPWAAEAIYALKGIGVINGKGENMFFPKDNMTRAEAAKIIFSSVNAKGGTND